MRYGYAIYLVVVALMLGCPSREDSCARLGDTFSDVRVDTVYADSLGAHWSLQLETLPGLPDAYFAAAGLIRVDRDQRGEALRNLADSAGLVHVDRERLEFVLPQLPAGAEGDLVVQFPDRRDYVTCSHPGSGDHWWLILHFRYGNTAGAADLTWAEQHRRGGY
ncbi:hypothetical protein [Lewinella sp. IMCC34191]|uniref:hypothetical protein n=1 Tax=Lewinella sp. IMCC34191 TaxID=2259172 RepID=UPI000E224550|nr:hypothetical protein [Lewinella sp. IMCC34191]